MSLFKIKTIWNVNYPQQQFDQRHLALGLINRIPSISIGSYKGNFRVFIKSQNPNKFFKLIFQKNFDEPIIDLKCVLHPDQSIKNNTIGKLYINKQIYVSKQMAIDCEPSFGIISYPLSLATLNSSIQTLNPKQVHPIKQSDPIYAFVSSNLNQFYYMDGQDLVKCKGDIQQWRIIVGKVRNIYLFNHLIILIGQNNLWEVQQAIIYKSKRLQEQVSFGTIINKSNSDYNIVICNFIMQTLIYSSQYSLLWAIKLDYLPIKLIISEHQSMRGAMIFLTDQGSIQLVYAGTQIQQRSLKPLQEEVNMQRVQKQTIYFLQKIKQLKQNPQQINNTNNSNSNNNHNNNNTSSDNVLNVKLQFSQPQQTQQFIDKSQQLYRSSSNKLIKCVLNIQLTAQSTQLTNILISLIKPNNLYVKNQQLQINTLRGKQIFKWDFLISKEKFPYDNKIKIIIRYQKGKSTKFIQKQTIIPLKFQCKIQSFEAIQNSDKKVTFKCTDDPLPTFNQLFSDILQRGSGQQKKAITFTLVNGIKTSIVYNKTLTKVKIQTQIYSGFCLIFIQFIIRVQNYIKKQNKKLSVEVNQIPLKQIANQIQQYHSSREQVRKQFDQLKIKTQQFKKSQKKLLIKMKQKNSSLQHISKLLQYTYNRVLQSAQKYQILFEQFNINSHNFQVSLKFVMQFVYRRANANQNAIKIADSILKFDSLSQNPLDQQGWGQKITKNAAYYLNKKYQPTSQNIQKLVTWVIAKVNSQQWN